MKKETPKFDKDNLLSIVERLEKLNEDAAAIAADKSEILSEAKSAGYDPKYINLVISLRKKEPDEVDEQDALMQMYRDAVGV